MSKSTLIIFGLFLIFIFILLAAPEPSQAASYSNGTLIRADGDYKVFVIHNNKKRWLRNEAIFNSYKNSWDKIVVLPKATVDAIPYNNLIRADGTKVYALNDLGYKRHIFNPDIFDSYGLSWADVADISQTEFSYYPDCNIIRQDGDEKVYYIEGTTRRWIKTIEAFYANNFNWEALQIINAYDMNHYTLGPEITGVTPTASPSIISVTPNRIVNDRETNITIVGDNFKPGATVKIGANYSATNVTVVTKTAVFATVPAGIPPGTYDLSLINPDQTKTTLANGFTFVSSTATPAPTSSPTATATPTPTPATSPTPTPSPGSSPTPTPSPLWEAPYI